MITPPHRVVVVTLIGLLFGSSHLCLASDPKVFLDFNDDNDPWTIMPLCTEPQGIVSVILEVGDEPLAEGASIELFFSTSVCYEEPDPWGYCGVILMQMDPPWCNTDILHMCDFMEGVGLGCEPPILACSVAPGVVLEANQRYDLGSIWAFSASRPCSRWAEAQYYVASGPSGMTNRIWLSVDPASVPPEPIEGDDVPVPSTWGRLKQRFNE